MTKKTVYTFSAKDFRAALLALKEELGLKRSRSDYTRGVRRGIGEAEYLVKKLASQSKKDDSK